MFKKLKIKKLIFLLLAFLLSINNFAAIVSDNDGNAFVTKGEFDALKANFDKQIDDYNTSIDGKIDGAIAMYLSGIFLAKDSIKSVNNPVDEVYCMKYKTDTEAKDMKYTYVTPYVNFTAVNWERYETSESTRKGRYGWTIKLLPYAKKSTGTRLYIENVVDKTASFDGCAEWVGYGTGVSESQVWTTTDVQYNQPSWGAHNLRQSGVGMQHFAPIENTLLDDKTWKIGDLIYIPNRGENGTSKGYPNYYYEMDFSSNKVSFYIYVNSIESEYTELNNKNMIIYRPETYYCFTEKDRYRDFGFDNESLSVNLPRGTGSGAKTYVEEIWKSIKTPVSTARSGLNPDDTDWESGLNDFLEIFEKKDDTVSLSVWWQANIGSSLGGAYQRRVGAAYDIKLMDMVCPTRIGADGRNTDYGIQTGRQIYTVQGFPWYSINNWKQLYIKSNDWVSNDIKSSVSPTMITTPSGEKHLSLTAGWPIIEVKKGHQYKYDVSFKEAKDHVVLGKLSPFETDDATTESDLIEWDSKTPTTWSNNNIAYVRSGETVTLSFIAAETGVLYLKWSEDEPVTHNLTGGGTIKPAKVIDDIDLD